MQKGSISDRPPDIGGLTAGDRITAAVNACAAWAYDQGRYRNHRQHQRPLVLAATVVGTRRMAMMAVLA
ncbi:hypothetical protein [Hydrogenophaga sp.]